MLEGNGEPVRGGSRYTRTFDEIHQGGWRKASCLKQGHRFVDDANSATISHTLILSSHILRCQVK